MNSLKLLASLMNPTFVELARHIDYINLVDDEGDLVIILGRYRNDGDTPQNGPNDSLVVKAIKTIQKMVGGNLYADESGRTILTVIVRPEMLKGLEGNAGKG